MKKIILLILLLITTGCSVDYEMIINEDNTASENITIKAENEEETSEIENDPWPIKVYYSDPDSGEYPEKLEGVAYYNEEKMIENNYFQKKLSYMYESEKYYDSNVIKNCYEKFYFTKNSKENTLTLSTSPIFLCMENYPNLNNVNIKITVNKKVTSHNASNVNGNTYNWNITRENYETSGIILTFEDNINKKNEEESKPQVQEKNLNGIIIALISIGVFIIFIIGIFIYKIKNNL